MVLFFSYTTAKAQNGLLDTSFNHIGFQNTNFGQYHASLSVVKEAANGQLIVAGTVGNSSAKISYNFFIARYNSNGSIDPSFGTAGSTIIDFASDNDAANTMLLQNDGKIIVAGKSTHNGNNNMAIVRLTSNGQLDSSFNGTGKLELDIQGGSEEVNAMNFQKDGKIILAGYGSSSGLNAALVMRINNNGTLDYTFGNNTGYKMYTFDGGSYFTSCLTMSDGTIYLAGSSSYTSNEKIILAKLNYNGTPINTFGTNGQAELRSEFGGPFIGQSMHYNPFDKNLYLGGRNSIYPCLLSITTDGTINTNFANKGVANLPFAELGLVRSFTIDEKGDFILCGDVHNNLTGQKGFLMKMKADASADTSWASYGIADLNYMTNISNSYGIGMNLQKDGKVLMVGFNNNQLAAHIARFNNNTITVADSIILNDNRSVYHLYPNPAQTIVNIAVDENNLDYIALYTLAGVRLQTTTNHYLNLATIPDGEYLVLIHKTDGSIATAPLLVLH